MGFTSSSECTLIQTLICPIGDEVLRSLLRALGLSTTKSSSLKCTLENYTNREFICRYCNVGLGLVGRGPSVITNGVQFGGVRFSVHFLFAPPRFFPFIIYCSSFRIFFCISMEKVLYFLTNGHPTELNLMCHPLQSKV